jgi:hypothetical protein
MDVQGSDEGHWTHLGDKSLKLQLAILELKALALDLGIQFLIQLR